MKNHLSLLLITTLFIFSTCKTGPMKKALVEGYDFQYPDATFVLPAILQEISGVTCIDSSTLASIQDELGIIFFYDLTKRRISRQVEFSINGDYEGIARVIDTIYVLRSDGTIFEICDFRSARASMTSYSTNILSKDNEGLCYDRENNRLLIACKEITGKGALSKDKRYVFAFDLKLKSLTEEPAYSFDINQMREYAVNKNIDLPLVIEKKGSPAKPELKFQPSGIAVHPLTNKLYILSAADNLLFVYDRSGNINEMVKLNIGMFNQPEGITFMDNGDMFISNEGPGSGPGTLRRLNYHLEKEGANIPSSSSPSDPPQYIPSESFPDTIPVQ